MLVEERRPRSCAIPLPASVVTGIVSGYEKGQLGAISINAVPCDDIDGNIIGSYRIEETLDFLETHSDVPTYQAQLSIRLWPH